MIDKNDYYDVFALGNALVDVLAFLENTPSYMSYKEGDIVVTDEKIFVKKGTDVTAFLILQDDFADDPQEVKEAKKTPTLEKHFSFERGSMTLVSDDEADSIYQNMGQTKQVSGGSAANSAVILSQLGSKTAFVGSVCEDELGRNFSHDIKASGVDFSPVIHKEKGKKTGRCNILVTSDAQRTMCTYLGVAGNIPEDRIDISLIERSKVSYIEGYLWDQEDTKQAIRKVLSTAKNKNKKTALTFSDVFCVHRHREEFKELVENWFDIIFANEEEIKAFFQVEIFDEALQRAKASGKIFALTRGEKGAVIVHGDEVHIIDASPPTKLVDTTGAGDAFAAGFLHGYTHSMGYYESAALGVRCASEVISHFGARPEKNLKNMLEKKAA